MEIVYGILCGAVLAISLPLLLVGCALYVSYLCARYPTIDRWLGGD